MEKIIIKVLPEDLIKILTGIKTVQIEKSIPKCKLPCEVYFYSPKLKSRAAYVVNADLNSSTTQKKLIKELVPLAFNNKIVAKGILDRIDTYWAEGGYGLNCMTAQNLIKESCTPE